MLDQIRDNTTDQCEIVDTIELIKKRVAESLDSIAIIFENTPISYRDLDRRANMLANHLQSIGVGPDDLVGLYVTRSIDMIVGILGILYSGGAYLPLDPSYPQERLRFIFDDAELKYVISQSDLLESIPKGDTRIICPDRDRAEISLQSDEIRIENVSCESMAYVIYTSGSTGRPKGVVITRANLSHFVENVPSALNIHHEDIYLLTASIAYALSVRQLFVPLTCGATIVLTTPAQSSDPLLLFELIKHQRVTLMDMVPSFWRTCIHRLSDLTPDDRAVLLSNNLRRIVSIGEPLLSDIPREWTNVFGQNIDLVNIFGQTETTGVVATYPIPEEQLGSKGVVPIGRSVSNTQLLILDSNLEIVPTGSTGELFVSSPCVARGYLNRPALTSGKFLPNPYSSISGDRLYRTGDLARYRSDGVIEFLGRGDHQVKIRGQRLELGEIEAVLNDHPQVSVTVVLVREGELGDRYLLAIVVPSNHNHLNEDELKSYTRQHLPDYMVPSRFMFIDNLPITPNGKVDRMALSRFDANSSGTGDINVKNQLIDNNIHLKVLGSAREDHIVLPRNETENKLLRIWQDFLAVNDISIYDNFFDLGGHSLLAVRLFSRLEQEFGIRLPITTLFKSPTIAKLAPIIESYDHDENSFSPLVEIQIHGDKLPFFGVHGQGGGVLFWRKIVDYLPKDQPFYGLQAMGVDGFRPAQTSIEDMAALYLSEIYKIQPHGPYFLGGYSMGGEIAFEMAQQISSSGGTVALLVLFDTINPDRAVRPAIKNDRIPINGNPRGNLRSKLDIWKRKISAHLRRISSLRSSDQIDYIYRQIQLRLTRIAIYTKVKVHQSIGKRLPDELLKLYLEESHTKALMKYSPSVYKGQITLIRASMNSKKNPIDSPMGWKHLASSGIRVICYEGTHHSLYQDNAKEVADKLNNCLIEARDN